MKKNLVVGEFHDGYSPVLLVGRKNITRQIRRADLDGLLFIQEKKCLVDIPGSILGTPEDWDNQMSQELEKAFYQ